MEKDVMFKRKNQSEKKLLLQSILSRELSTYQKLPYAVLESKIGTVKTSRSSDEPGDDSFYQLEFSIEYDNPSQKTIRVMGSIDDGGWLAYKPITDSIIVTPEDD